MHKKRLAIVIFLIVALLGCSAGKTDLRTGSYKALAAGAAIYESGYPAFLELHQKGLVSDAQKTAGRELAVKYWAAYHAASEALVALDTVQSAESKDRVTATMAAMSRALAALTQYIQPFIEKR